MNPQIEILPEKKLIGTRINMSMVDNKTSELCRDFMPRRNEIKNNIGTELYSMQNYSPSYFENFNPNTNFEKWAAAEVSDFDTIPEGMETYILSGLYANFHYIGLNTDTKIFEYIYGTWIPNSIYTLDNRPHFQMLGEKYKKNDPNSEENIWIPIKLKK